MKGGETTMFGKKKDSNDCCNIQFEEVGEDNKPAEEKPKGCCPPDCC
jgi:hypothetical protein